MENLHFFSGLTLQKTRMSLQNTKHKAILPLFFLFQILIIFGLHTQTYAVTAYFTFNDYACFASRNPGKTPGHVTIIRSTNGVWSNPTNIGCGWADISGNVTNLAIACGSTAGYFFIVFNNNDYMQATGVTTSPIDFYTSTGLISSGGSFSVTASCTMPDVTPPVIQSAATNTSGTQITLTYDENISTSSPYADDFTVKVNSVVRSVSSVSYSGVTCILTVSPAISSGQTVTVSYNNSFSQIIDNNDNPAASLTNYSVTNNASGLTSTITFDTQGGSAIAPITQIEGTVVTPPADPTKTGYTFEGWVPAVPATMPVDDITCVAQWLLNCLNPANGGTIATDQSGCSPFDPALLTNSASPTGFTGTLEYKWQKSNTSGSIGFTDIASSNAATYDPPAGHTATTWYKRLARVTCMADWTGARESNVLQISVDPASVGGTIAGSATVCSGTNTTTLTLSGQTGNVIKWQYSTDNWVGSTDVSNTTTTLIATNLTTTTKYRAVIQSGVCSTANSGEATVTINPIGQVNQPGSQVVCNATSTAAVTFGTVNTGGTTTYAWTNDTPGIGLAGSGTGNIASFTAINTGTALVIATIVVTPTFTNGGTSCSGSTKTFTITVNPTGQVNQPGSQVVCNATSTAAVTFGTVNTGGTTTYAWTNDTPGIGLAGSGTGNIASFTAINTGTAPVIATIVVTPTFANGGTSCSGSTKTFTITVNPTGQVNQPGSQVVCNATSTSAVTFGTVNTGGTTTYAWTNDTPGIGLAGSGTGNIASFTAINTGTAPVIATIVVTPTFTNGGASCSGSTKTFTITVNPTGQVNQPGSQVVCNAASTSAVTFGTVNTGGTTTYAWTNDTPGIGLVGSGTGNIASFTAINTGTAPVIATIVVTPTFANGGTSCSGSTKTFTITVNPTGQVNQSGSQVVCNATSTAAVTFGTVNTGVTAEVEAALQTTWLPGWFT